MSLCEAIQNLSDPEKLSARMIMQLVCSLDSLVTEHYTASSFPWTIEIILFRKYFTEIMKIRLQIL